MATWHISSIATSTIEEEELKYHEQIGRGASGEVYRVTWSSKVYGDIEAAAKKIFRDKDKSIEEQFGNEIKFLRELTHQNIVKYFGHVVTASHVVIVTEYAAKGSLYDYLKKQTRLPEDLKKKWRIQAARGIRYLQENGIVHRDIKSPNFFITANDDLKIGDFGIAKVLTTTTSTNTERGTLQWQAPEVFKERQVSPKADIFALGVVLWELETCEVPYETFPNFGSLMWAIGAKDVRPDVPDRCPSGIRLLIQQCWHKDRRKRPHIDAVVSRLLDINEETEEPDEHHLEECEESFANMQWHLKSEVSIKTNPSCCHWITEEQLAVATMEHPRNRDITVYEVSDNDLHFSYQIKTTTSQDIRGIGVSESIPDRLLVIHSDSPAIYQYPCQNATEPLKRHKFCGEVAYDCQQIVTNSTTAVIRWSAGKPSLLVLPLPDFNDEKIVECPKFHRIKNIAINSQYLLVQGLKAIEIKSVNDLETTLMWIDPPPSIEIDPHTSMVTSAFSGRNIYIVYRSEDRLVEATEYVYRSEDRLIEATESKSEDIYRPIHPREDTESKSDGGRGDVDKVQIWISEVKPENAKHNWVIAVPKTRLCTPFYFSSFSERLLAVCSPECVKVYHLE